MSPLVLPVSHSIIDLGGYALLALLIIEFAVEILRGKAKKYDIYPSSGPVTKEGAFSSISKAIAEVFVYDALLSSPLAECHTGAYYERKHHLKRIGHIMFFYGFLLLIFSTLSGFIFDRWVTSTTFIPSFYLGSAGEYIELFLGSLGGSLVILGFILYWPARFRGENNSRLTSTDAFLLLLLGTVITGFMMEDFELFNFSSISWMFWIHMTFVFLLFATMPYTKFSHVLYQIIWNFYDRVSKREGVEPRIPESSIKEVK
jgi:nitrate reductase gamma subunit